MTARTVRAVEYVRMSTDQQSFSIPRQRERIAAYAAARNYVVLRTYADVGVSGVTLAAREGLRQLLADALSGAADFEVILTYDVSRWGRFQDPDEAAHYEYLCKVAGIRIEYCEEPFPNDGAMTSVLLKQLKRAMAAEYSRDLSVRVTQAKRMLAQRGYWQCGSPGFGLHRMLVDQEGKPVRLLREGERKLSTAHRTVLVAGTAEEVAIVRDVFRLYVIAGLSARGIARDLNSRGALATSRGLWTPARVRHALSNEGYVGVYVFGRTWEHLGAKGRISEVDWLRVPNGIDLMVSRRLYDMAQTLRRRHHSPTATDEDLIGALRQALKDHGMLSADILKAHPATHDPSVYKRRFGGLAAAYSRAGYLPTPQQRAALETKQVAFRRRRFSGETPPSDAELTNDLQRLYGREGHMSIELINSAPDMRHAEVYRRHFGGMAGIYAVVGHRPTRAQILASRPRSERRSQSNSSREQPA